jgi:beta-lactamase class A
MGLALGAAGALAADTRPNMQSSFADYRLDFNTPVDAALQSRVEALDTRLRADFGMAPTQSAVGVLDLLTKRLALIRPDALDYAASVPKIGILLAWFQLHPDAAAPPDAKTRHELGLMIKSSDNELATKYSEQLGLKQIQQVLNEQGFYDPRHGGGIWVGKHYGKSSERLLDPVGGHSHAANVRQLLRFYLLLEQERLVSPAASRAMREIFRSPDIPHHQDKFVRGLAGRDVEILRKSGWWEKWAHDSAIVTGPHRHYIIVALTHHPKGEAYLPAFAAGVDDLLKGGLAP